ncbi:cyclic nucleotide-binding domain-containing protein [Sinimarinibacterium sp. CAU 1509]|uniref:MMPL family transporter n=1 Tax=Sinimarinibacterium sp. CAU 1509 TaxID=2562283 RepID=UPI0010AC1C42|nr:MMPL family transporter [Sinimarinibacterium sp. CAU 1509]TJY62055.1 cyclic nucleotide-binding domain-containing protein [Sinimarinibacterium sp. CAU 1509]
MQRLILWLSSHPLVVIAATLLLSFAAALCLIDPRDASLRLKVDPSLERLLPTQDDDRALFDRVRAQFGETDPVLLAVGFDNVYTPDSIEKIDALTRKLGEIEGVRQVMSIANVANPVADDFGIDLSTFATQARVHPERVKDFPAQVNDNPIYRNALVSADGKVAAFALSLNGVDENRFRREHYTDRIRSLAGEVTGSDTVWITGSPVIMAETTNAILRAQKFTIPAIFGLVVLLLYIGFRSVRAVLLSTLTIGLALLWTMASAVLMDLPLNLVTALVPPLVTTLCLSYAVHLLAEFYERHHQDGGALRLERVFRRMGVSLLLSGGTTIAGFMALVPGSLPAVAQFAGLSALGVAFSVLLTLVFLPAILTYAGPKRPLRILGDAMMARKARKLALFDLKWRNWIITFAVLLIPIDLYFASNIRVGTEYIKSFGPDATVRRDYEAINRVFDGANPVAVVIETYVNDALTDPALIREIEGLQKWLQAQPEVGAVVSYVDHLKLINRNLNDGDPAYYRVPTDATAVKQLLVFGGSDEIRRLIDSRFRTSMIAVRIKVDSSIQIADFVQRTEARLREMPPPLNGRVTGSPVLATRTVNEIASGQLTSLLVAFGAIWAMLALMFTSARSALLAMLPNILPVGVYFGTLGLLDISLNPTTSLIACVVLGIAVDDTIHFLARLNTDARAKGNEKAAVKSALSAVLRPVTFTMIALCLGFLIFTGSELQNQVQFGALAAFTIFVAWLADITLTPALGSKLRIVTLWDILRLDLGQSPQHTIPLLSGLSLRQARVFALMSKLEHHKVGERIIQHGDYARDIYVVIDGVLQVWVDRGGERKTLSTLQRGAVMGETGYFGQRRTANVDAQTPVRLLRFDSQDLERLRQRYPRIAAVIYRNLNRIQAERLARATAMLQ